MHKQRAFIGHHGPELLDDGTTRFRIWAPDAQNVSLIVVGAQTLPMTANEDGWYSIDAPYGAGTSTAFSSTMSYRCRTPPPAPRPATCTRPAWSSTPAATICGATRTGWAVPGRNRPLRDARRAVRRLRRHGKHLADLAELGVTAIELMPIAEFPGDRNWGYDGVLPYAPEAAYGSPEELKHLIDTAHGLGLMVFLDVVYNHFGPDGNYLGRYAKHFFRHDQQTPWGDGIDFRRREVRDFFIDNTLMWLLDYRFDGLRFDAVHAIPDRSFLTELAERVHASVEPGRHVHLVLENEDNRASLLTAGFTAQWNDDGHNVLHALLTDESQGYYADYHQDATTKLARFLGEGFIYQGQNNRRGEARGEPSGHLPPTSFVLFLQNHDQTGNRAFGERLVSLADADALRAATAVLLLSPMVPLLFMGEEWGRANHSCSSPATTANWPMQCAKGGATSSPSLPSSPTKPPASAFPTPTRFPPSKIRARISAPARNLGMPNGMRCIASCWASATGRSCRACRCALSRIRVLAQAAVLSAGSSAMAAGCVWSSTWHPGRTPSDGIDQRRAAVRQPRGHACA